MYHSIVDVWILLQRGLFFAGHGRHQVGRRRHLRRPTRRRRPSGRLRSSFVPEKPTSWNSVSPLSRWWSFWCKKKNLSCEAFSKNFAFLKSPINIFFLLHPVSFLFPNPIVSKEKLIKLDRFADMKLFFLHDRTDQLFRAPMWFFEYLKRSGEKKWAHLPTNLLEIEPGFTSSAFFNLSFVAFCLKLNIPRFLWVRRFSYSDKPLD